MSPHTSTRNRPSAAQLSYLRNLALQTGTTFTAPRTGWQASREIERLKALKATRGRDPERTSLDRQPAEVEPDPIERSYATAQQPGEVIGYGSTARWRQPTSEDSDVPPARSEREPLELGRYRTKVGEQRALYGVRIDGMPRVIDAAADDRPGRIYVVEDDLECFSEVQTLVAEYLADAERMGVIPMAKQPRGVRAG